MGPASLQQRSNWRWQTPTKCSIRSKYEKKQGISNIPWCLGWCWSEESALAIFAHHLRGLAVVFLQAKLTVHSAWSVDLLHVFSHPLDDPILAAHCFLCPTLPLVPSTSGRVLQKQTKAEPNHTGRGGGQLQDIAMRTGGWKWVGSHRERERRDTEMMIEGREPRRRAHRPEAWKLLEYIHPCFCTTLPAISMALLATGWRRGYMEQRKIWSRPKQRAPRTGF